MYRQVASKDREQIDHLLAEVYQNEFEIDLNEAIVSGVEVDENDTVVALLIVRPIYEAIMILDAGRPLRDKVKALESLVSNGMFECARGKIKQVHAFVISSSFGQLLKKQFGFKTAKGETIIKDI
jgi:hypothetical protein